DAYLPDALKTWGNGRMFSFECPLEEARAPSIGVISMQISAACSAALNCYYIEPFEAPIHLFVPRQSMPNARKSRGWEALARQLIVHAVGCNDESDPVSTKLEKLGTEVAAVMESATLGCSHRQVEYGPIVQINSGDGASVPI